MILNMYFVLLIGLFLYAQGTSLNRTTTSTPLPVDRTVEDCLKETGANPSQVKWLKAGHYNKSNSALKKWAFCYLVKTGVMSSAGVLRQHVVLNDIPDKDKNAIEKTINKCLYKKAHDPVDTAWHYLSCFHSKQPKYARDANHI